MPHPYIWNLGTWGYPKNGEPVTYYKCRLHGVTNSFFSINVTNQKHESVFTRKYCSQCMDRFFQQFLDPMTEATAEEVEQWRKEKSS